MPNQDAAGRPQVSDVGWAAAPRRAGACRPARARVASDARSLEGAVSRARDVADARRCLELADTALLLDLGAGVLRCEPRWVSARALLGAGESFAPAGRGARSQAVGERH